MTHFSQGVCTNKEYSCLRNIKIQSNENPINITCVCILTKVQGQYYIGYDKSQVLINVA